jgi:glucokinase
MTLTIGVDVGGTKVAAGLVDEYGTVLEQDRRPTPSTSPDQVVAVIGELVDQLRNKAGSREVEAVGLGAAGLIDAARATVLFAPNLAWRKEPLRDHVAKRVGLPVVVENDANAMAWAEYRFGAGRGVEHLVCLTVGTGIGGGIVQDGQLVRGGSGAAGEFGHVKVVPDGRRCGCGGRGCWEQYCSGRALVWEAQEFATVDPTRARRMIELADDEIENITGQVITRAAREGDQAALDCYAVIGGWLGRGLSGLAAILDPSRFVIGGGVIDAGDLLLDPARTQFTESLIGEGYRPPIDIVAASLGPIAGLVGAADLARLI